MHNYNIYLCLPWAGLGSAPAASVSMFSASCLHPVSLVTVQPGPAWRGIVSHLHHSSQQTCKPCLTMFGIDSTIYNTQCRENLFKLVSWILKAWKHWHWLALSSSSRRHYQIPSQYCYQYLYIPNIALSKSNIAHMSATHALHLVSGVIVASVNGLIF